MTIDTLTYLFQVNYENGDVKFIRIDSAENARDLAWRLVAQRTANVGNVRSIEFLHIERKY
jgi:hypothetical protein